HDCAPDLTPKVVGHSRNRERVWPQPLVKLPPQQRTYWMRGRKSCHPVNRAGGQLPKMQVHGQKACNGLDPTRRRGAESTTDPEGSTTLHLVKKLEGPLVRLAIIEPEPVPIRCDGHDTGAIKETLLGWKQSPRRVTQHAHCPNSGKR